MAILHSRGFMKSKLKGIGPRPLANWIRRKYFVGRGCEPHPASGTRRPKGGLQGFALRAKVLLVEQCTEQ